MLDNTTKRRIDDARDILVGKVPDPKSQVEQITIALIYKFMDDMDKESVEFGGEATFFTAEYEKYSWTKIFDPKLGGYDMLNLYSEAIDKLNHNPNIPQLFRDIFKNAYLPYRDPETLKLFLKTINEFTYDHSEKLGDAFEYLLSVLGSQGDAGQFRTPRHIIDFIVAIVQPKKGETICDPACGTAGFLISAYKYILNSNTKKHKGDELTPEDRKKLMQNFTGYDISPDMVRLSLANMYLHGFTAPRIYEYDTLTSEERWGDYFDIILANPPFMSPKGGIKPHKRFSLQANRSEVLFADYIAEHINPTTGRAGVIVPEGIIFQSATAYKALRKMLVDKNYLYAVVSLPAGLFQPYSGVKTSILLMDKTIAKKTDNIVFVKIEADGFDLGAQRRPIEKNDLPAALIAVNQFKEAVLSGEAFEPVSENVLVVPKEKIKENGDYNLSVDRYRVTKSMSTKWEVVALGHLCEKILSGGTPSTEVSEYWNGNIPWISSADIINLKTAAPRRYINEEAIKNSATNLIPRGNIIVVTRVGLGKLFLNNFDVCISQDSQGLIIKRELVLPEFLLCVLYEKVQGFKEASQGTTIQGVTKQQLSSLQIPLPPLSVQQEIVTKIESYQRIIDGAKQVVESYNPQIDIDPEWEMVELGEVCKVINGRAYKQEELLSVGKYPVLRVGNFFSNREWYYSNLELEEDKYCVNGDLLYAWSASFGSRIWDGQKCIYHYHIWKMTPDESKINKLFLHYILEKETENIKADGGRGIAMIHITKAGMEATKIPLPPMKVQKEIVENIEREHYLISANRELIKIFEQKIKDEINKLWQAEKKAAYPTEGRLSMVAAT